MTGWLSQHWVDLLPAPTNSKPADPIKQLRRTQRQTVIFRIGTHHAPLNAHLHRTKKERHGTGVYFPDSDETVEQVLL